MYVIEWDFLPAPGRESEFVRSYGPSGIWVELFRKGQGYIGTDLLASSDRPGWYRTVDRWLSEDDYVRFRAAFAAEYARIDSACEALTVEEVQVVQPRSSI
jgi:hypothetical protein